MKLLILYTSAGAGHQRAAEALQLTARNSYPELEVVCRDALDFMPALLRRYYGSTYLSAVNSSPELWGFFYDYSDKKGADSKTARLMRFFDRLNSKKLVAFVAAQQPEAVVCTHFLPSNVLLSASTSERKCVERECVQRMRVDARTRARTHLRTHARTHLRTHARTHLRTHAGSGESAVHDAPISLVLTDFDVHSFCLHEGMHKYFVPSEEVKYQLMARGVAPQRIEVTGIPVHPQFADLREELSPSTARTSRTKADHQPAASASCRLRESLRAKLGVPTSRLVVLVLSGGFGVGRVEDTLRSLLQVNQDFTMLVVAGRNEKLRSSLDRLALRCGGGRMKVFGFVTNMHELMSAADLAVTKSGGLTVSECLTVGLPMAVLSPIPGQEVANCNYLMESGAAVLAKDSFVLQYKLERLLADRERLAQMSGAAFKLARPSAARDILAATLG